MRKLRLLIVLVSAVLLQSTLVFADARLEVSPRSGELGDTYVLSVIISGADQAATPTLSRSDDFDFSYIGPQSSISIINGTINRKIAHTYRLIPRRTGQLKTPGAEVQIAGATITLEPVEVTVSPPSSPVAQRVRGLSLHQSVEPTELFVGQQAITVLELRAAINLIDPQFGDLSYDGFWSETIADNERSSRIIRGDHYDVLRFRKALYPLISGTLEIPSRTLKARVRDLRRSRPFPFDSFDPFDMGILDDFFSGGKLKDVAVQSNSLRVQVKELPAPPAGFPTWGASMPIVGETTLTLNVPEGGLKTGETKTAEIVVLSTGNLSPIKGVRLNVPPSIKIYEDAPETKTFESGGALMQKKTFRVSLIPMSGGSLRIPPVELGYFDTAESGYRIARTREIILAVQGTPQTYPQAADAVSPQGPVQTEQGSASPQLSFEEPGFLSRVTSRVSLAAVLLGLTVLLLLGFLAWMAFRQWRHKASERSLLSGIRQAQDVRALRHAFSLWCAKHFSNDAVSAGGDQLRAVIEKRVRDPARQFALDTLLDQFDTALYAPAAPVSIEDMRNKTLEAVELLRTESAA